MFKIIGDLLFPSAVGFINGSLHGICYFISIHNNPPVKMTRCTTGSLC